MLQHGDMQQPDCRLEDTPVSQKDNTWSAERRLQNRRVSASLSLEPLRLLSVSQQAWRKTYDYLTSVSSYYYS